MPEDKQAKLERVYALSLNSASLEKPKRAFLGWKCPKCGDRLSRETIDEMITAIEGASAFANKVASDGKLPLGVYNLTILHYVSKCGYEFAESTVLPFSDASN